MLIEQMTCVSQAKKLVTTQDEHKAWLRARVKYAYHPMPVACRVPGSGMHFVEYAQDQVLQLDLYPRLEPWNPGTLGSLGRSNTHSVCSTVPVLCWVESRPGNPVSAHS